MFRDWRHEHSIKPETKTQCHPRACTDMCACFPWLYQGGQGKSENGNVCNALVSHLLHTCPCHTPLLLCKTCSGGVDPNALLEEWCCRTCLRRHTEPSSVRHKPDLWRSTQMQPAMPHEHSEIKITFYYNHSHQDEGFSRGFLPIFQDGFLCTGMEVSYP
jgi:hypothetical protein